MRIHFSTPILGLVAASLALGNNLQVSGTFSRPASRVRPRFRYWLPDASVDAEVVAKDVASAASIGAGGIEFLPFFEYGGDIGRMPTGADWSTYNFGTPAFVKLFERVLEAHDRDGLVMDFALGPNQGQGVPASPDDEGLQWDMVPFTEKLPASGSFNGKIPGWGTGNLISLVTALVKSNQSITYPGTGLVGIQNVTYDEYQLNHKTLKEVTGRVDRQGHVKLSLPKAPNGSHYRVFAFYERLSGHKNLKFDSTRHRTIFDNGSYAVDHFSAQGAAVVGQFWEKYILKGRVPMLLAKVGNYAYGSSLDALAAVPAVDAPECESLGFDDNIDSYRSFAGPARLAGRKIVSNEMGAVRGSGLQYHLPHLIFQINRAFLGGVNQMVLHGQSYSGTYYETTWPGHVPFSYLFSEPFSPHLPSWDHGLNEIMDYIARNQHILQGGMPKADVVIYNKESATTIRNIYQGNDLLSGGWSWNYLSANNLKLEQAVVRNRVLAPDGPAWKALIVESSQNLTLDSVKKLKSFAQKGLPVVFSGGSPTYYPTGDGSRKDEFERQLSRLLRSKNVHSVASGKVADKLKSLGVQPQIQANTNGTFYTSWIETNKIGYALIYSDLVRSTGTITVNSKQAPFYFNAWTGEITPVLVYTRTKATTTIPVDLAGNQTLILAFGDGLRQQVPVPKYHVEKAPSNVLVPDAFKLSQWSLTAEHWEAPEDLYDSSNTVKHNTTHQLTTPISWSEVSALNNASGVGYYTTSFQWPPKGARHASKSLGAYIHLSTVIDVVKLSINGHMVPPLDVTNAVADITPYLKEGKNIVSLIIPTTLWNYVRTIITELKTAGSSPLPVTLQDYGIPLAGRTESGLVGTVTLTPFKSVVV
ncbi:hypothetical protein BGZ61DRAFT_569735 [Ilyonectria robusta]|uniref:uncharacterized protein n=1 Tax=Ilyonectria robusta TaxID=1079257 RepID=UPI001E8EE56A|nr:uncharacterized protein BGZ61DRAFT_569735 [Ilyonectria robusta]KAH8729876.1 hypothetical protein BGZ61DRAFT_569735 [Ilyonectria robusta]